MLSKSAVDFQQICVLHDYLSVVFNIPVRQVCTAIDDVDRIELLHGHSARHSQE